MAVNRANRQLLSRFCGDKNTQWVANSAKLRCRTDMKRKLLHVPLALSSKIAVRVVLRRFGGANDAVFKHAGRCATNARSDG